jgi:hypothetical protein
MHTNHNPDDQEHVSRREAMRHGVWGTAGMIAAGGLSARVSAAPAEKTPEQKAAQESPDQIGHPDLLVGWHVAQRHLGPEAGFGLRLPG